MPINVSERNERPHQHVNLDFYWAAGKLTISAGLESARNRKQDADQNLVTEALCQCTEWLNNVSVTTTGTPLRISRAKPSTASQNNCVACTRHTRHAGLPPDNGSKAASVVACVTKCAQRAQPATSQTRQRPANANQHLNPQHWKQGTSRKNRGHKRSLRHDNNRIGRMLHSKRVFLDTRLGQLPACTLNPSHFSERGSERQRAF